MSPDSKLRASGGARAALLLAVVLAAGCTGVRDPFVVSPVTPAWLNSLAFVVEPGVNANRPVRVALVRAQDAGPMFELMGIESAAWFGIAGDGFRRTHPQALVDDWELVPGRVAGPFTVAVDVLVAGALFCETGSGSPPLPVERDGDVTVQVGDDGCTLRGGLSQDESSSGRGGSSGWWGILNPFDWFD